MPHQGLRHGLLPCQELSPGGRKIIVAIMAELRARAGDHVNDSCEFEAGLAISRGVFGCNPSDLADYRALANEPDPETSVTTKRAARGRPRVDHHGAFAKFPLIEKDAAKEQGLSPLTANLMPADIPFLEKNLASLTKSKIPHAIVKTKTGVQIWRAGL